MKPRRIALTGGIATGKSTVARLFCELGAALLDADAVARDVVNPGTPGWHKLRELLGKEFFDSNGQLKRRLLRNRIIFDPSLRSRVNSILHPAILETMDRQWREWQETDPHRLIIFDIPLLFELHLDDRFDTVILVYVPERVQMERLMTRDGLSRAEAEKTLSMQHPIDSKRSRSHIIIDNSQDLEHTSAQVKAVWKLLNDQLETEMPRESE